MKVQTSIGNCELEKDEDAESIQSERNAYLWSIDINLNEISLSLKRIADILEKR